MKEQQQHYDLRTTTKTLYYSNTTGSVVVLPFWITGVVIVWLIVATTTTINVVEAFTSSSSSSSSWIRYRSTIHCRHYQSLHSNDYYCHNNNCFLPSLSSRQKIRLFMNSDDDNDNIKVNNGENNDNNNDTATTKSKADNNNNNNNKQKVVQIQNLTQEQIAELIEMTFINACMQLAEGYIDLLKLFIVAVKASYERQMSISKLINLVNTCPNNTAGRTLLPEEIQLRTLWINCIYLILEYIGHNNNNTDSTQDEAKTTTTWDIDVDVRETYSKILKPLVEKKQNTNGNVIKIPGFIQEHYNDLPSNIDDDAIQTAIISQTIKVLWYTLVVLEEEQLANEHNIEPGTPIPGTRGSKSGGKGFA